MYCTFLKVTLIYCTVLISMPLFASGEGEKELVRLEKNLDKKIDKLSEKKDPTGNIAEEFALFDDGRVEKTLKTYTESFSRVKAVKELAAEMQEDSFSDFEKLNKLLSEAGFDIDISKENLRNHFNGIVNALEAISSQHYNEAILASNKLTFAYNLFELRRREEERVEREYFNTWESITKLKEKIDALYIKTSTQSSMYGRNEKMTNYSFRKRRLFRAYSVIFDKDLERIKAADTYREKLAIEEELYELMLKMEELAPAETKELEKIMNKEQMHEENRKLITDFEITAYEED